MSAALFVRCESSLKKICSTLPPPWENSLISSYHSFLCNIRFLLCGFVYCLYMTIERRLAHAQTLHGLDSSKFSTLPLCGYLVKIRMDNRLSAGVLSLLLGDLDTLPLALQNILPFQLRHSSKYREHECPSGRGGVYGLLLGHKFHPFGSQALY